MKSGLRENKSDIVALTKQNPKKNEFTNAVGRIYTLDSKTGKINSLSALLMTDRQETDAISVMLKL